LNKICFDGGEIVPVVEFILADFGLPTNPPNFGIITQSCKKSSSEI
jgi:hypothetical protein